MTTKVPPPQPGDRALAAIAYAALDSYANGTHVLTAALVAAKHPELTPAQAVAVASSAFDGRAADASAKARALIEEARRAEAAVQSLSRGDRVVWDGHPGEWVVWGWEDDVLVWVSPSGTPMVPVYARPGMVALADRAPATEELAPVCELRPVEGSAA